MVTDNWSLANLFQSHTLTLWLLYVGLLLILGILSASFKGSVQV